MPSFGNGFGTALGLMQSAWAIGYGLAAVVTALVLPRWGWRAVFFVGIIPALLTLWIRKRVPEPALWRASVADAGSAGGNQSRGRWTEIFRPPLARYTFWVTLMNACTMFGWWGLNLWIPAYLSLPPDRGGVGLSPSAMAGFVVAMQAGMWLGYVTFGFIGDAIGRKRAYVTYLVAAGLLIAAYSRTSHPAALLVLGPFVAFFGTGYFSGFGAVTAELYRTSIRATAQGFTYNIGRIASASAPLVVGSLAQTQGFGTAFATAAAAFGFAAIAWLWIPETKGRALA